jgi:hypothetical protein
MFYLDVQEYIKVVVVGLVSWCVEHRKEPHFVLLGCELLKYFGSVVLLPALILDADQLGLPHGLA